MTGRSLCFAVAVLLSGTFSAAASPGQDAGASPRHGTPVRHSDSYRIAQYKQHCLPQTWWALTPCTATVHRRYYCKFQQLPNCSVIKSQCRVTRTHC
jgi:hypothetical protein